MTAENVHIVRENRRQYHWIAKNTESVDTVVTNCQIITAASVLSVISARRIPQAILHAPSIDAAIFVKNNTELVHSVKRIARMR